MSLHLIESSKSAASSTRKRGGATASVIMHCVLVAGAFTAASAAPVLDEPRITDDIVYVAPKPPEVRSLPPSAKPHSVSICDCVDARSLPALDMKNISIEIPTVTSDIPVDMTPPDFSRRGSPSDKGMGLADGGFGGSLVGSGDVMSESQVERIVSVKSGYRTPRYPEALRAAGVEETLTASFVVDTLGLIEAGSLQIPDVKNPSFIGAVREALAKARFNPAEAHGRRVRQHVVQSFVFSLSRN